MWRNTRGNGKIWAEALRQKHCSRTVRRPLNCGWRGVGRDEIAGDYSEGEGAQSLWAVVSTQSLH
jgi:hypothetical protein